MIKITQIPLAYWEKMLLYPVGWQYNQNQWTTLSYSPLVHPNQKLRAIIIVTSFKSKQARIWCKWQGGGCSKWVAEKEEETV